MRKASFILAPCLCAACGSRFTQAAVEKTELDIRAEFEQKGFIVEQVSMVRDADRHMSGLAKVRKPGAILGKTEMTKNCAATMDEGSGKSIWQCE